jgi:hypothetical protein
MPMLVEAVSGWIVSAPVPEIVTSSTGVGSTALKGAPEIRWQSAQWHTSTFFGSTVALNEMAPQWH